MRPWIVCLGLLFAASDAVAQQELTPRQQENLAKIRDSGRPARPGTGDLGTGSIQYDPGAPADAFPPSNLPTTWWGNLFNSANGLPLSAGTITQISVYIGQIRTLDAFKIVNVGSTFATAPGLNATASYAFAVGTPYINSSSVVGTQFFAGMIVGGLFDQVGLRSATTNGQGFHGLQRSFNGNSTPLPGLNAMVRVRGNVVIPVELLEFEVD